MVMSMTYKDPNSGLLTSSGTSLTSNTFYYTSPSLVACKRCRAQVADADLAEHTAFHESVDLLEKLVRSMAASDLAKLTEGFLDLE